MIGRIIVRWLNLEIDSASYPGSDRGLGIHLVETTDNRQPLPRT